MLDLAVMNRRKTYHRHHLYSGIQCLLCLVVSEGDMSSSVRENLNWLTKHVFSFSNHIEWNLNFIVKASNGFNIQLPGIQINTYFFLQHAF